MTVVLLLHAAVAVAAWALGARLGSRVFLLAAVAPTATALWALGQRASVVDGGVVVEKASWVGELGLALDLRLDAFSLVMVALISVVGCAVMVYATGYFSSDEPGLDRFAATLVLFAGAMVGIVVADNLLGLFVFWELTSITSYLLIGFDDRKAAARGAALQAILTTGSGGLAMLAGFVLIGQEAGTYSLSGILADPPSGTTVNVALGLVLVGAFTKSAQVPFHFWLPAAMTAPTPVSAYLHSATMVKAGVYLVARLAPAFAVAGVWRPAVLVTGLLTMLLGGYRALRQHDLKLLLAYGTISQLGLLMVLFGAGTPEATHAGVVMLVAHAAFKATLFLVVGAIDHTAHTRDLRRLSGLGRSMPATFAVGAVAAASMAGLPPLFGFIGKEASYEAFLHGHHGWSTLVLAGAVAGSILTFAYSARFLWGAFADRAHPGGWSAEMVPAPPEPSALLVAPAAAIGGSAVVLGLFPGLVDPLLARAGEALDATLEPSKLALWHGFNAALALSVLTVAGGVALFATRATVERAQRRIHRPWWAEADDAYQRVLHGLNLVADRVTGVVQSGSLPVYLGIILATVLALPGTALLLNAEWPADDLRLAESPLQVVAALAVMVTAVAATGARRRLMAVLLLGGVGYGVTVLFLVQGAPDLALTQLLVETLAVVIFVLVLRHLPDRFSEVPWRVARIPRVLLAVGVGVFVTSAALVMGSRERDAVVSAELVERAVPEAEGKNVVNVILVDYRALDTLGEITVIVAAALGILTLVRPRRRARREP